MAVCLLLGGAARSGGVHVLAPPINHLFSFSSQNPPPDPPQIYLTNVGDPPSLIPLGPVKGAGSPPLQVSVGPQFPPQDGCGGGGAHPVGFSTHSHSSAQPNHHSPVFVIINPPAAPSAALPPPIVTPPPTEPAQHPVIIKEEHLPSEEELLEIVSLGEKRAEEEARRRRRWFLPVEFCFQVSSGVSLTFTFRSLS